MRSLRLLAGVFGLFAIPCAASAQQTPPPASAPTALPTIAAKTAGLVKMDGFVPIYWDEKAGKIWMEIPRFDQDFLYYISLAAGMGQNDVGLDRGSLGPSYVVKFQRVGPKILMVQSNQDYRASSANPMERKSVADAFPVSVIWGFKAEAEEGGRALVDATDFFMRDAQGAIQTLRATNQGAFRVDATRSAPYLARTKAFPQNTEVEMTITLVSDAPGGLVQSVTPTAEAMTVREHHSFVQLPDAGFTPREADPRAGYFTISYMDYSTPIGQPIVHQYIARHRLVKKDPAAAVSEPVKPIVYYLDPGTPEPIRSALLDGARWWSAAFEAAGFRNAFRVEMLPDSADPMDVRYNLIEWVHRSTRGWSYGTSVVDPRTGEILKGLVRLGSLRVRQDYLIGEGLLSPYINGDEDPAAITTMALARMRQLAAHEVGHTLGLAHNYIASAQRDGGVQSVMDYPHPLVTLTSSGDVDLSQSYPKSIGEWDKVAIRYGYAVVPAGRERATLDTMLINAAKRGISFLTDQDARPTGSAHPLTNLWDNGSDIPAELDRMLAVRKAALDKFGEHAIRTHMPLATMEEALVPLYLHHRYETEAAVKTIGGQYYTYALRGDGQQPRRLVPAAEQQRALDAVLRTIAPSTLALPRRVIDMIPPRPSGYPSTVELFDRYTGLVFDAVSPAASAADMTISLLLDPQRAARLVEQHALDPAQPGLTDLLSRLRSATFGAVVSDPYQAAIARASQRVYVDDLMQLVTRATMPEVRAIASFTLKNMAADLRAGAPSDDASAAHAFLLASDIDRFLARPLAPIAPPRATTLPPGMPIGTPDWTFLSLMCDGDR